MTPTNKKPATEYNNLYEKALSGENSLDETLNMLAAMPKHRHTRQEIDEARGNFALMNDRVFLVTFIDNKNNRIVKGIADAVRKIHNLAPIPPIEQTKVQDLSLLDVLGRGMVGDLTGWGKSISIAIEAQKQKQEDYAVRGTLTAGNLMRINFNAGEDYANAPDAITVNILDFRLPELKKREMFCSRIVRAEYESRETFLEEKYSEYYIEIPKMNNFVKEKLPPEYYDLWDLCCIFKAKINEHEEVIRMQAITNPTALELSDEVKKAVSSDYFVEDALKRKKDLELLRDYILRRERETAKEAAREGEVVGMEKGKAVGMEEGKAVGMEKMLIMALQSNVPAHAIETMRKGAGITETRLAELKKQAQLT